MSYLYKIAEFSDTIKGYDADGLVNETSNLMGRVMDSAKQKSAEETVKWFYALAAFAQPVYLHKNTRPDTVAEATDYADAQEYYMETLKEGSTIVTAVLNERFGNLVPSNVVQQMATFASEEKKLTKKKIEKHIASMMPSPRKKTNDKRGGKK